MREFGDFFIASKWNKCSDWSHRDLDYSEFVLLSWEFFLLCTVLSLTCSVTWPRPPMASCTHNQNKQRFLNKTFKMRWSMEVKLSRKLWQADQSTNRPPDRRQMDRHHPVIGNVHFQFFFSINAIIKFIYLNVENKN